MDRPSEPVHHLYAHIPFCPTKCDYCAFVTHIGSDRLVAPYISALRREASTVAARVGGGPLETVYLGGGTPSILAPAEVSAVLRTFRDHFGTSADAEITIEAHPSTVDAEKLAGYRAAGVNRISFGIESLARDELRALGRIGDEGNPAGALRMARQAGFDNIAADLMYGIPLQTPGSWFETLQRVLEYGPDHLSLYPLSIEAGTVFGRKWRRHDLQVPTDDLVVEMYHLACDLLFREGYGHYEVGSWCRPGLHSRHNLAYWHNRSVIGLGVGAHGYVNARRTVNVRQTGKYIRLMESGMDPTLEREELDGQIQRSETIMLGLRLLQEGLDLERIRTEHGWDMSEHRGAELDLLADAGLIRVDRERVFLTESAVPVANEVWERLAF